MTRDRAPFVRLEKVDLPLQLQWIRPVIVAVQDSHERALTRLEYSRESPIATFILGRDDELDPFFVVGPHSAQDIRRTICRAVVDNDDLMSARQILVLNTSNRLLDELRVIVSHDYGCDQRRHRIVLDTVQRPWRRALLLLSLIRDSYQFEAVAPDRGRSSILESSQRRQFRGGTRGGNGERANRPYLFAWRDATGQIERESGGTQRLRTVGLHDVGAIDVRRFGVGEAVVDKYHNVIGRPATYRFGCPTHEERTLMIQDGGLEKTFDGTGRDRHFRAIIH